MTSQPEPDTQLATDDQTIPNGTTYTEERTEDGRTVIVKEEVEELTKEEVDALLSDTSNKNIKVEETADGQTVIVEEIIETVHSSNDSTTTAEKTAGETVEKTAETTDAVDATTIAKTILEKTNEEITTTSLSYASNDQGYTIRPGPYRVEGAGNENFSNRLLIFAIISIPAYLAYEFGFGFFGFLVLKALLVLPIFAGYFVLHAYFSRPPPNRIRLPGRAIEHYLSIKDASLSSTYRGRTKIPIEVFFEAYIEGKIDLVEGKRVIEILEARHDWASFRLTLNQVKYFLLEWVPGVLWHSRVQDDSQVRDHYERGDDFHQAFLGESMVYTCGIVQDTQNRETLEQIQENKLRLLCEKLRIKPGDRHLDIGCGWGRLVCTSAQQYGAVSTGVTLCHNQIAWGERLVEEWNLKDKVRFLRLDYRDIPAAKYNKISCIEMAEHVGIRRFNAFLLQVREMMEDDGLFLLQVAGLRKAWQLEDLCWGLFMAKYVFPGADASTPLYWYVNQLEKAGFEVQSVDNVGVHYSATLDRWYHNWEKNRDFIIERYGERWWRLWAVFLAWSTLISRQGSATCYQIVASKNLNAFDREALIPHKHV